MYIYLTSRWLKKRRIPFVLFAFAQYENNYEPPETDIDFRRREDHQSDLNIGLNVRIICLRIMLIGHRKDMKDCVYTNLPVKFLNPNKKLSRLTLRVFNFIRGGVQL